MVLTDPFEGSELHAVAKIRAAVAEIRARLAVWEPRPMPPTFTHIPAATRKGWRY